MIIEKEFVDIKKLHVKEGKQISLKDIPTDYQGKALDKQLAIELLESGRKHLTEVQEMLYAQNRFGVLIIFQAMDAAGKDSAVKHIMSGFNPMGVRVHSFKTPTPEELDHDYLWRHAVAMPRRGEIAIHNRSHYENVLVTRIHPEYILNERLPGVDSVDKVDRKFWNNRFEQIVHFENGLRQNGTIILKFFLHLSKKEQKKRFLERIDDPAKNWKFASGDLKERARWDDYQRVYEEAINATSMKHAPWYIIPADDKWYTRLAIAAVISKTFEDLDIHFPHFSEAHIADLNLAREQLMAETETRTSPKKKKKKD